MTPSVHLNNIPPEQRSRIIRSARKLGKVLGTTPFLLDSAGTHIPVEGLTAPGPYVIPRHHSHSSSMVTSHFSAPSSPTKVKRRHASIFDLPELSVDNLPRDSIDSTDSAISNSSTSTASSLFPLSSNMSTPRTSVDSLPPTSSFSTSKTANKRKHSVDVPPPLVIALQSVKVADTDPRAPCEETYGALTTNATALNGNSTPPTPRTPHTPTDSERVEIRRKKLSKVMRTLGENVPIDLVFSTTDSRTSLPASPLCTPQTARFPRTDSYSPRMRPSSAAAKPKTHRKRSMSLSAALASKEIQITYQPCAEAMPFQPTPPVFASGAHARDEERWVGSWNRSDIETVQRELRAMRWR